MFLFTRLLVLVFACASYGCGLPIHAQIVLDNETLVSLDTEMQSLVDTHQVANASYGLWQDGELIAEGYFGPVSNHNPTPVSDTTIHRIYSMTKPVTAIGMLILMERGAFSLDDPITKLLPEFKDIEVLADYDADGRTYTYRPPASPTIRQLLSHTAGFAYGNHTDSFLDRRMLEMKIMNAATSSDLIAHLSTLPYARAPGAEWKYSIASDLQGALIERITGESLDAFLSRELFEPLGMKDTGFYVDGGQLHRVSDVTHQTSKGLSYDSLKPATLEAQSETFFEGGAGLFSTQSDYGRFLHFLLNDGRVQERQILSPETLKAFRTNAVRYRGRPSPVSGSGKWAGLGFGFGVGTIENPFISDMGAPRGSYYWRGALGTWFWVDPENDIFFIAMLQSSSGLEDDMLRKSMRLVYGPSAAPEPSN